MLAVGLTGGVGCGKSAVADLFARLGVPVIDADGITRSLTVPGAPEMKEIAAHFGAELILPDGSLDRRALRTRIFSDAPARKRLESLLHPRVRDAIRTQLAAIRAPYCIVVVPLLIETGMTDLVDRVLVVDCDPAQQLERVMRRDHCSDADAQAIITAQLSREKRLTAAHDVIENHGDLHALHDKINHLHLRFLDLAAPARA